jgi:TPR repeat protein
MKNDSRKKLLRFQDALPKGRAYIGKWLALNFQDPVILDKYVWLNIGIYLERSSSRVKKARAFDYYLFAHSLGCNYSCLRFADLAYWFFERNKKSISKVAAKKAYVMCKKAEKSLKGEQKARAINLIGCFRMRGFGCTKNSTQAIKHYKRAARLGNKTAKLNLSDLKLG